MRIPLGYDMYRSALLSAFVWTVGPLALLFVALALLSCGPRPSTCSERDAALIAHEAQCLARVHVECAGIPDDEPCPFEEGCKAYTRGRCQ